MPRTGIIPELFLPSLSKTLAVLVKDWREYASQLAVTLYEVAFAMLIACGFGILAGALVGGIALLRNLLLPVFSSLYAVPIVILYPIFTAWFGIGSESKIIFAGVYGFFPVMLSTAAGIRTIDPQLLLAARSMGATLPQQITRVIIPASIPTVLTGLRLGGALTIIGVVVSEMLTSAAGIGYLVTRYRTILDSPHVFGAIVMILLLSILFDMFARAIERRTMVWQTAGRRQKEGEPRSRRGARARAGVAAAGRRRCRVRMLADVRPHALIRQRSDAGRDAARARRPGAARRQVDVLRDRRKARPAGDIARSPSAHTPKVTGSAITPGATRFRSGSWRRTPRSPNSTAPRMRSAPLMHPPSLLPALRPGRQSRQPPAVAGPCWSIWRSQRATIVLWSALPRDWQDPDGWVDRALDQVAAQPLEPHGAARSADRRDAPPRSVPRARRRSAAAASGRTSRRIACRWWTGS